jgi:glycosyltransferase involved in cell wall biosynthesis
LEVKTDISIVIPCFNTRPEFIREAIESVEVCKGKFSYAIILVDDGSNNTATSNCLQQLRDEKNIHVIFQTNKGPAAARNTGVNIADSEYILFLDSDDRLLPGYIEEGIKVLQANPKAGVVYSNALAFGDASRANFIAKPFDSIELLIKNYIPMCALVRKQAWEDVGGIDENLLQFEDWEFWISIYKTGWEFVFINKPMFEYRISKNSLIAQAPEENFHKAVAYIYAKHWDLVYELYHRLYANSIIYKNDAQRPLRSFIKYSKKKYLR